MSCKQREQLAAGPGFQLPLLFDPLQIFMLDPEHLSALPDLGKAHVPLSLLVCAPLAIVAPILWHRMPEARLLPGLL